MVKTIAKPKKKKTAVSKEELELAAYYRWLSRGCPLDDALTDWVEAETLLKEEAPPVS